MAHESLLFGIGTLVIGGAGFWLRSWIIAETPKGRLLVETVGIAKARVIVGGFFLLLVGVGILLAGGWLVPLRW